jgi:pterin-4a-carbinolamine dehydratase
METKQTVQELKAERVQEETLALMRKRLLGQDDPVGTAMAVTQSQAEKRLKAGRVQSRLKRMQGWSMLAEGKAIDRVRNFESPLVAASYLMFASLLARQVGQPLRVSQVGNTVIIALTGRSKGPVPGRGLTEEVLDLAEQLG